MEMCFIFQEYEFDLETAFPAFSGIHGIWWSHTWNASWPEHRGDGQCKNDSWFDKMQAG